MSKALSEMSFGELGDEMAAGRQAMQAAEYQEGLGAWQRAKDAAQARLAAVNAEIDLRLSRLGAAGGVQLVEEPKHGG